VQVYRMTLTMLSPVHIGAGCALSPMEYVVREEPDGVIWFYAVNGRAMFGSLSDRQRAEFAAAVRSSGPGAVRRFVLSQFDAQRHAMWQCQADEVLLRATQAVGSREAALPVVWPMTRTGPKGDPYLPGSSIKGAMRTAWLWWLAGRGEARPSLAEMSKDRGARTGRLFEAEVLGCRIRRGSADAADGWADPLRAVKVTDATLCPDSNVVERIVFLNSEGKVSSDSVFCDSTFSALEGEEGEEITATGQLRFDRRVVERPVSAALKRKSGRAWPWDRPVAGEISIEELLEACRQFYGLNLRREVEKFYGASRSLRTIGQRLLALASNLQENEALLRVGKFSHLENMTVWPYAQGISRNRALAGALRPMGWVKMRLETA